MDSLPPGYRTRGERSRCSPRLVIILVLILVNGIFSGAEIAILSLRKTRLAELVAEGRPGARSVSELQSNPEGFLATVQIGITVVGATAAAFGGASMAADIAPAFLVVPGVTEKVAHDLALATVVVIVSFFSLVLGELVPKSLALRAGETYALLVGSPLRTLAWTARPIVAFLTGASNLVLRVFGDRTTFTEARLSKDEIQQIVEEASTIGSVDPHAGEIANRALDFSSRDAYTVMVAASAIVMVDKTADVRKVAELAVEHRHSRMPVYEGSREHLIGFANVRDFLATAAIDPDARLEDHIHPLLFLPDSMTAPDVLQRLQEQRTHLGIVLDEQGTVLGLITIEDLVEELVGEILSEDDPTPTGVLPAPDGSWVVSGDTPLHEIERALDLFLPKGDYATIAGLCLQLAGRIPAPGDRFRVDESLELEIVDATPRRVRRVRIRPLAGGAPRDVRQGARAGPRSPRLWTCVLLRDDVRRRLSGARTLLEGAPGQALSIPEVARRTGMSPFHFDRTFKAVFGETPHQYRMRHRLERARHLLARTDLSVTEICLLLGFSSLGSFSTSFTQRVGCTPTAYRARPVRAAPMCMSLFPGS